MPDINLAENTSRPVDPQKPKRLPGEPVLTDPGTGKTGLGGVFRSMFKGKKSPENPVSGVGVRKAARSTERILSEKRSDAAPSLIPLPETGDVEVNLLNEELTGQFVPRQKIIQLFLGVLAAVVIVGGAYVGLTIYEKSVDQKITNTKKDVAMVRGQVSTLQQEAVTIQTTTDRVKAIKVLLSNHVHWSSFFSQLERYTLPSVNYGSSFAANIQGQLSLGAITDSYEHAAQQYLAYQQAVKDKTFIQSFSITGANRTITKGAGTVVNFGATLEILPKVFSQEVTPSTSSASSLLVATCYLYGHQESLTWLPVAYRADFATTALPVSEQQCSGLNAVELDHGKSLVTLDDDNDGLVNYLELLAGTQVDNPDSDADTVTDIQEVATCSNPIGTGTIANCDQLHPLKPRL